MKKNQYVGNETGLIKGDNVSKQNPKTKAVEGKDLRAPKKGGKK